MFTATEAVGELELPAISPDECREQLARILSSSEFQLPERGRRFLTYIIEQTLLGRSERIKAYSIATEVFGRDSTFDPKSDPIVRIEAGQLRRALERYYLKAGQADAIAITIPKGRYIPVFSRQHPVPVARVSPKIQTASEALPSSRGRYGTWKGLAVAIALVSLAFAGYRFGVREDTRLSAPDVPQLLVTPFEDLSSASGSSPIAKGLTQEIIGQISKFKDVVVIEAPTAAQQEAASAKPDSGKAPRYALAGNIDLTADSLRLQLTVTRRDNGQVLWANSYVRNLKVAELLQMENDIAMQVATAIAQPYGIIYQADLSRSVENPPADWQAYSCTLKYYDYRTSLDAKRHPAVRTCLEKAVADFPNYATAWALLSQTYIDEIRFRYPPDPSKGSPSIDKALKAARRAVELDPQNVRGLQAEMFALYFNTEIEAALKVGEQALKINPTDTELRGEFGFRLAMSGDWDRGCPLVAEVRERNPGPLAYYEAALALCSYFHQNYADAAMWVKKTTAPDNPNYHVIAAAIFGEGGYAADAERERNWLVSNAPSLVKNMRRELAARFARQADIDIFIGSLKKAGIPVPD